MVTLEEEVSVPTVVSLLNMKGGVGKTTLAHNLAWDAAYSHDLSVLVVDLDPQFNASQCLMGPAAFRKRIVRDGHPTIEDVFEVGRARMTQPAELNGKGASPILSVKDWGSQGCIDLLPSRLEFAWTLRNSAGKERHLRNFLVRNAEKYDLVLIDCPPTESMATQAAYMASTHVLVPVRPEFLAAIGLPLLASSLAAFRDTYEEHDVKIAGIVYNDVNDGYEHARAKADVGKFAEEQGWHVFHSQLTHSDSYPKGSRQQKPIFQTDYARWTKRSELHALGREFLDRVGLVSKRQVAR